MAQNKYIDKRKIINRFILGMIIWMAILLTITFIQSSYSTGLFFLMTIGISLVYFVIAQLMGNYRNKTEDTRVNLYSQSINKGVSYLAFLEILLVPGWILGSWIFGIFHYSKSRIDSLSV